MIRLSEGNFLAASAKLIRTRGFHIDYLGYAQAFVRLVRPHVATIVVSNPMKTKAIAEANIKTDKVDALVLAQLLRCDYLPSVWVPSSDIEDKLALAARRSALVSPHRHPQQNPLRAGTPARQSPEGGLFTDKGIAWLKHVDLDPLDRALIDADIRLLEALAQQSVMIDCDDDPRIL